MSAHLRWSDARSPDIVIELDLDAAGWLCDALEAQQPKDFATHELRRAIAALTQEPVHSEGRE